LSGSSRSPKAVDPVTSQNSTVTVLRCWRGPCAAANAAPHSLQNLASCGFARPQAAQTFTRARLSQAPQKAASKGPDVPTAAIRPEQAQLVRCRRAGASQ